MPAAGPGGAFMAGRMKTAVRPTETLRAYIEGNLEFIVAPREQMKARTDIVMNGALSYDAASETAAVS